MKWQNEHKCAACGRLLIATPQWLYRDGVRYYCSYTCWKKEQDKKPKKKGADE